MMCCHEMNKNEEKKFVTQKVFVLALDNNHILFMNRTTYNKIGPISCHVEGLYSFLVKYLQKKIVLGKHKVLAQCLNDFMTNSNVWSLFSEQKNRWMGALTWWQG